MSLVAIKPFRTLFVENEIRKRFMEPHDVTILAVEDSVEPVKDALSNPDVNVFVRVAFDPVQEIYNNIRGGWFQGAEECVKDGKAIIE